MLLCPIEIHRHIRESAFGADMRFGKDRRSGNAAIGRPIDGGERGIRTLGAACDSTHDFQSCTFSQLGHLSVGVPNNKIGRQSDKSGQSGLNHSAGLLQNRKNGGEGGIRTHDPGFARIPLFESGALSHSATSPTLSRADRYGSIYCLFGTVNALLEKKRPRAKNRGFSEIFLESFRPF